MNPKFLPEKKYLLALFKNILKRARETKQVGKFNKVCSGVSEPVLDWVLLLVRHFIKIFKINFYGLIAPIKSEIVSTLKKRRRKESCKI